MKILILEDDPSRVGKFKMRLIGHEVFFTDDTKVCIEKLKTEKWDALFLDHDLGGKVYVESGIGTGYEVACFLEEFPEYRPETVLIHSLNGVGAKKMLQALKLPDLCHMPFLWESICGAYNNR
jgi:hypothetical protein